MRSEASLPEDDKSDGTLGGTFAPPLDGLTISSTRPSQFVGDGVTLDEDRDAMSCAVAIIEILRTIALIAGSSTADRGMSAASSSFKTSGSQSSAECATTLVQALSLEVGDECANARSIVRLVRNDCISRASLQLVHDGAVTSTNTDPSDAWNPLLYRSPYSHGVPTRMESRRARWLSADKTGVASRAASVLTLLRIVTSVIHIGGLVATPLLDFLDEHAQASGDDPMPFEGSAMLPIGTPIGNRECDYAANVVRLLEMESPTHTSYDDIEKALSRIPALSPVVIAALRQAGEDVALERVPEASILPISPPCAPPSPDDLQRRRVGHASTHVPLDVHELDDAFGMARWHGFGLLEVFETAVEELVAPGQLVSCDVIRVAGLQVVGVPSGISYLELPGLPRSFFRQRSHLPP